jgi:hypothetical protein
VFIGGGMKQNSIIKIVCILTFGLIINVIAIVDGFDYSDLINEVAPALKVKYLD